MNNKKNYNIGLDIGTGSVGWCVTDEKNNIIKNGNKNMWGVRIFEEANPASIRRNFRSAKRRLTRRKARINILQDIMKEDIEKEYPNFLPMLRETSLDFEDKRIANIIEGKKHNLFSDDKATDKQYYKTFSTIYHLRNALIKSTDKFDIRLVYLAIHHIIKYRGNFLYEGDFSKDANSVEDKIYAIVNFLHEKYNIELNCNTNKIIEIMLDKKNSNGDKKEKLIKCFIFEKDEKTIVANLINSFLGYVFDINKIFDINIEKNKISFSKDIEDEEKLKNQLNEHLDEFETMKDIYSWYVLQDILEDKKYISEAFILKFEKYKEDLEQLKKLYKKYLPDRYNDMFKIIDKNNYSAYNGKTTGKVCKKCSIEEFISRIKKDLESIPDNVEEKQKILEKIEGNNFLRKLNVTENSAIPYQLHKIELEKILENQSKYYNCLKENKEHIIQLLTFRIPYYVGPLAANNSKWSWVVRKSNEKILPWTFSEIVDEDATAEKFITRMTNTCTYLLNEPVIPKQSILYSYYCVLNELNNIRINNKHIAKDMKKIIIDELFKTKKKITKAMVIEKVKQKIGMEHVEIIGLSDGENFMSNMSSYIDLKNILGEIDETNIKQCEDLIYWITIFEDKKILKRKIIKEYPDLTQNEVEKLVKLKFSGWSRLSRKLLCGLKSNNNQTIMEILETTHLNFMQIINKKEYGFDKKINSTLKKETDKISYKDIEEIPTSPVNKRAIWQTINIVKEITKKMQSNPTNIYIEFARSEEKNKKLKDTRAKQLLKKYEAIEKAVDNFKYNDSKLYMQLKARQSDNQFTEKMYLYFIQEGKCLYTGKPLDIEQLNKYEVDHIIPRSYIKDDSIDNKALVLKFENQRKSDSLLLTDEIIDKQQEWWKHLLKVGLISQNKYFKLIRRKFFETDDDRNKFVKRQLVETRQITKHVTNLLESMYGEKVDIYSIRAEVVSNFREKYQIYKNRDINNFHHAKDAFILSIIGNIINEHIEHKEEFIYSEYVKAYFEKYNKKKNAYGIVNELIEEFVNIEKIKEIMKYKDCYISRMLKENTGEFYNQTLYGVQDKPVIPLKKGLNVEKYGGYSGENKAYCVIFEYVNEKNKKSFELIGIPIKTAYDIKQGKETLENYIKNIYLCNENITNLKILKNKILMNQEYLNEDNEPMMLCSDKEVRSCKELIVDDKIEEFVYYMNLDERKLSDEEKKTLENQCDKIFLDLLKKLKDEYKVFNNTYIKLQEKITEFSNMEFTEKKAVINGLINLMKKSQGNLKVLGLGDREGRMSGKKFKDDKLLNITFINKSVTGMYERRYKISGMENDCC